MTLDELKCMATVINDLNHRMYFDDTDPIRAREKVVDAMARWELMYGKEGLELTADRPRIKFDGDMTADTDRMEDVPETYWFTLNYRYTTDRTAGDPYSYETYFTVRNSDGSLKDTLDRITVTDSSVAIVFENSGRAYLAGGYPEGTPCPFCGVGPMYGKVSDRTFFVRCPKCGRFGVTYVCRPDLQRSVGLYLWEDVMKVKD